MKNREAVVRLDGQPVGSLVESGRQVTFNYDSQWLARADAVPISVTLPLRPEPYITDGLHPFFENLLPEGWLLELATKKLKISKDDAFGLLLATCADCVGAVEIVPVQESVQMEPNP
ncbi:MAG: HipA N-terminal domain-containing protein [Planctomycetes bacterium]|nr:HipA N-terminal domain-containing protein [Planctomycetota bacterium]